MRIVYNTLIVFNVDKLGRLVHWLIIDLSVGNKQHHILLVGALPNMSKMATTAKIMWQNFLPKKRLKFLIPGGVQISSSDTICSKWYLLVMMAVLSQSPHWAARRNVTSRRAEQTSSRLGLQEHNWCLHTSPWRQQLLGSVIRQAAPLCSSLQYYQRYPGQVW